MHKISFQPKTSSCTYLLLLGSLAFSTTLLTAFYGFFEPRWETNDDVGMSMFAHGYGIAAYGTPNLIFSNVLWGYLVRLIPEISGTLGYSIATIGVLAIISAVLIYSLLSLGHGYLSTFSVVVLALMRPALFPQFIMRVC